MTVAILLPLSGQRADIAQAMLKAAQLALDQPGAPRLDARDTGGTPAGAAAAAQAAIAGGSIMILGPLTSGETAAVAPVARQAGIPVLAFTNDPAQAQPGVWPLGITPRQQVFRLVAAVQSEGRSQIAALLPDSDFGRSMASALLAATAAADLPPPRLQQYAKGIGSIGAAMQDLSEYEARGGRVGPDARPPRPRGGAATGGGEANGDTGDQGTGSQAPIGPPPFDALLLADTGDALTEIASFLPYYAIPSSVRLLGPALWATPSSGSGQLPGAWYAAPDPAARAAFSNAYAGRYGSPPPAIADLAFDAASIARVLGQGSTAPAAGLTQPAGFDGSDGVLALQPDGQVRRGLAVFEIQRGGGPAQMIQSPPASPTGSGA